MAVGGGRAVVWAEQRGGGYGNRPQAFGLGGGGRGNVRVWQRGGLPPPRRGGSGFSLTFQNCSAVLQPTKVKIIKENGHFLNAKARLVAWTRIQSETHSTVDDTAALAVATAIEQTRPLCALAHAQRTSE